MLGVSVVEGMIEMPVGMSARARLGEEEYRCANTAAGTPNETQKKDFLVM